MLNLKSLIAAVIVAMFLAVAPSSEASNSKSVTNNITPDVLNSIAPWVYRVRYIPVYVDGQLAGYIKHEYLKWVEEADSIEG